MATTASTASTQTPSEGSPIRDAAASGRVSTGRLKSLARTLQPHVLPWTTLFAVALAFRLRQLHEPLYGDQALYFYLSKTLGFAPDSLRDLEPLWTHVVVRPFLYLFFWPWANVGLTAFQVANILVGATIPCLIYSLSVRFGVRSALAAIVAFAASVHPVLVAFSARGFPDNLATALILAGYLAYFSNRAAVAVTLSLLTVLTKEAFAMFLLPLLVDSTYRFLTSRSKLILAPLLGLAAVVVTSVVSIYVFDGRLQGWGSGKPEPWFFRAFLCTAWFAPLYLLLLLRRQLQVLLIGLAAPAFFVIWGFVLHRGIEQWYVYGPFCVALFPLSVALQAAMVRVTAPVDVQTTSISAWQRIEPILTMSCAVALLGTIIVLPEQSGWRSWLDLVKAEQLFSQPKRTVDHTRHMAQLIEQRRPQRVLVMNVFWAFAYYPLGTTAKHISKHFTGSEDDAAAKSALAALVQQHEYVVLGGSTKESAQAEHFRRAFKQCELHRSGDLALYEVDQKCLTALSL
jgi:hypothetical protein